MDVEQDIEKIPVNQPRQRTKQKVDQSIACNVMSSPELLSKTLFKHTRGLRRWKIEF